MEQKYFYINNRFYFAVNIEEPLFRDIHSVMRQITAWQDKTIFWNNTTFVGYECMPGTKEAIDIILEKAFHFENITEDYIKSF